MAPASGNVPYSLTLILQIFSAASLIFIVYLELSLPLRLSDNVMLRFVKKQQQGISGHDYSSAVEKNFATEQPNLLQEKISYIMLSDRLYKRNKRRRELAFGRGNAELREVERLQLRDATAMKTAHLLELYAPGYPCIPEERFGVWKDGGKWVCRPDDYNSSSIVYSIGSNGMDSFELELFRRTHAKIHVFDPSLNPKKKARVSSRTEYTFHDIGIGMHSSSSAKQKSLADMMNTLGHDRVDILKIDCEGCEHDVFPTMLALKAGAIGQILVEVHGITRRPLMTSFFQLMERHGFRLFHIELNWFTLNDIELAYIHESLCKL